MMIYLTGDRLGWWLRHLFRIDFSDHGVPVMRVCRVCKGYKYLTMKGKPLRKYSPNPTLCEACGGMGVVTRNADPTVQLAPEEVRANSPRPGSRSR